MSALDDLIREYGEEHYPCDDSCNEHLQRARDCHDELSALRRERDALRRGRDEMRRLVAGCAPYVHKAEHVIGCQARYGEKICACGLSGIQARIDAALRGEGKP